MADHTAEVRAYGERKGLTMEQIDGVISGIRKMNRAGQYDAECAIDRIAAAHTAPAQPVTEALATDRQVDYILSLLARRTRQGDGGGFMTGPTTADGIRRMTRTDASTYITSLKGAY